MAVNSVRIAASRERERHAYALWIKGLSFAEIGRTKNPATGEPLYRSKEGARAAVLRARQYFADADNVETLRGRQLASLMAGLQDCARIMNRRHPLIDRAGNPVMVRAGDGGWEPANDDTVTLAALREQRHIWARVSALFGLDAPAKLEHSIAQEGDTERWVAEQQERISKIRLLPVAPPVIEATAVDAEPVRAAVPDSRPQPRPQSDPCAPTGWRTK